MQGSAFNINVTTNGNYGIGGLGNTVKEHTVTGNGTWDSAVIKFQFSDDDGSTWLDYTTVTWSANFGATVWLGGRDRLFRINSASSAGSTDLTVTIRS